MLTKSFQRVAERLRQSGLRGRAASVRLWLRPSILLPRPPKWLIRLVVSLTCASLLALLGGRLLVSLHLDESTDALGTAEIARLTNARLKSIASALDSTRDWLAADPILRRALLDRAPNPLFPILSYRDSSYASRVAASELYPGTLHGKTATEADQSNTHGFAVYSPDGRLIAWCSIGASTVSFDTVISGEMLMTNRDRGIFIENEPIFASLASLRKIVSRDGHVEGYVETKRQLVMKEPLSGGRATSFVDDIHDAARRDFTITFGGLPGRVHSGSGWTRFDLFGEPGDPVSFVGTLEVNQRPIADSSVLYKCLRATWSLGCSLALFLLLLWLLISIADPARLPFESSRERSAKRRRGPIVRRRGPIVRRRPLVDRVTSSAMVLVAIIVARVLLAQLGGFALILGSAYQDASDFASDWGFGIVRNPLELFVTTGFATSAAVMFWIIWMPSKQLVRDDSRKKAIDEIVRRERSTLLLFTLAAVIASQLFTDALSATVESVVSNGGLRYLAVKQVLPAPGMLMMLLSFLGIGVTYLFLTSLILTFALRAAIFLLPRRIAIGLRISSGSALVAALMIAAVFATDQAQLTDTTLLYRSILAGLIFAVSLTVIIIDAFSRDPTERDPSFLYKLPRSSRTILFILAGSAIIIGPLVASKQLGSDKEIARRNVDENAEVGAPELQSAADHVLSTARLRLDAWSAEGHDTAVLRKTAFLIWLDGLREHPQWNAVVDIYGSGNEPQSHFATLGAASELHRILPSLDSVLAKVRGSDSASKQTLLTVPCFTASCTPAVSGALRYSVDGASRSVGSPERGAQPHPPDPPPHPIYVTVSVWSDLPALTVPRSRFNLLDPVGQASSQEDPVSEGGFIVAQYRPNMRRLTNTPAFDVPATIPPGYERLLRKTPSFWSQTIIDGVRYQTLFYRSNRQHTPSEPPAIFTVSVPEPTTGRILEFVLRMNAIGLIYGAVIVLILLIARQVAIRRLRFTLKFRDRIFLIVLLIALVPLVVVTNVTRTLLTERAHSEQQDRLTRDALVIRDRIAQQIEGVSAATLPSPTLPARDLQIDVDDLSQIIGRDFSVYDPNGRLRASSRPELYESGMLASILDASAFEEIVLGKRLSYERPVRIGSETYQVGYQPVTSSNGAKLLGVIALATMEEQSRIESEIARTTSFIYGTFAALGLVLLGMGALFAARVASPVLALIRATERVGQGKLTTSIPVTREDEIGELMQAFNSMTRELEKSREIVAQTEREFAWKEMARQVAHEIKNPLTPMKLSVQHLEHAHETKDPNFNSIFRRVIRTVSEQIDVLTRIATEFSRFGAMPRRKWGPVSLRRVADSAVALFDAERSRIRFVVEVPKDLPLLHSDEDELRRAFVNLIRNGIQAMAGWGIIVIRAEQDEGMVHVRLSDTGAGMSEATLKRVFDPNFSTKTSGMGLGLAIVKKTITDMSGSIRVESRLGHGTTFFIDLPARGYVEEEE